MTDISENLFEFGMSPQALAEKVLEDRFGKEIPSIPIDPFKLMREYGIVYQFMEFEDLEGIYLVPEDDNDIPLVGINYKRKITRQRFTAAHELCHHLKDRRNEVCPKGGTGDKIDDLLNSLPQNCLCRKKYFYQWFMNIQKTGKFRWTMHYRLRNVLG